MKSVESVENPRALSTALCPAVEDTCAVRVERFDTPALKLKVKELKFGCVWIRTSCHHLIKKESAHRQTHAASLPAPPCEK